MRYETSDEIGVKNVLGTQTWVIKKCKCENTFTFTPVCAPNAFAINWCEVAQRQQSARCDAVAVLHIGADFCQQFSLRPQNCHRELAEGVTIQI